MNPTQASPLLVGQLLVGPLRIAGTEVTIRTNCAEFAKLAAEVFADLIDDATGRREDGLVGDPVLFDTIRHDVPHVHWSIRRNGLPCELDLREDAVINQQQWELNRIVIEAQPIAVHSAAVAVGGLAVLLAGQSHSGKTTLAGWLAGQADVEFLADEVVAVNADGLANPYPRPLGLRQGSPTVLEAWRTDPLAARFMPNEQLVPVRSLGATVRRSAAPIALIVFPRFDPDTDRVTIEAVSQADAVERLVLLTPGLARHGRAAFEQLCRLSVGSSSIAITYPDVAAASETVLAALTTSPAGTIR
jgi:hypothetical protein